jgi:MSHA biogenesis protein MshJ
MKLDAQTLRQAWDGRNRRERWILFIAAIVLPLLLADTWVWNPWRVQMKALAARSAQANQDLRHLEAAQAGLMPQGAQTATELQSLRSRLVEVERQTQAARATAVSPQRMAATLREITEARGAVHVVALRSLPVTAVAESGAVRLYRHSFELQVEGSYADIARYIDTLEQTTAMLRWNAVELDATRHPVVAARLEVFTLSEQSSWIQL